jgi:hypothetical protein
MPVGGLKPQMQSEMVRLRRHTDNAHSLYRHVHRRNSCHSSRSLLYTPSYQRVHFVLALAFRKNSWRSMAKLPHHIWILKHEMAPPSCPFIKSRKMPPLLGWEHTVLFCIAMRITRMTARPNPVTPTQLGRSQAPYYRIERSGLISVYYHYYLYSTEVLTSK